MEGMNTKKLYKSAADRRLCGVCAGIAEYLEIDPTVIRLAWVFLSLALGSGVLVYLVCALVIPEAPIY